MHGSFIALIRSLLPFIVFGIGIRSGAHAQEPDFRVLGTLGGTFASSSAWGVSADGSVVVGESSNIDDTRGFVWSESSGMEPIGDGSMRVQATGVSADGSVIIGHRTDGTIQEAFRLENGQMQGLGDLPGPFVRSFGNDVSADGSVVVGTGTRGEGFQEAVIWSGGEILGLGSLGGDPPRSQAVGISRDGQVVVGVTSTASTREEAFRWTVDAGMVGLGDLPGGTVSSIAHAASADGSVIVGSSVSESGNEAFRWENGLMSGLGDLPGGAFSSVATAVSGDGQTVVGYSSSARGTEAFIWTEAGGMRALADVLANDYGLNLDAWTLTRATRISADGRTVVGSSMKADANGLGAAEAWRAVLGCPDASGKTSLDACICLASERVWNADESVSDFERAENWEPRIAPVADDLAVFPDLDEPYGVVTGSKQLGIIEVRGNASLLGPGVVTLTAPCGDAIVVESPASEDETAELRVLTALQLEVMGNIQVPRRAGMFGALTLNEKSRLFSNAVVEVLLGLNETGANVDVLGESTWDMPDADVHTGTAFITVGDSSRFVARRLFLAGRTDSVALPVLVQGNASLEADSILAGLGARGGVLSVNEGRVTVNGLRTGVSSSFPIGLGTGAELAAETAAAGVADSSTITVADSAHLMISDVLSLGYEEAGTGHIIVEEGGILTLGFETNIGRAGTGRLEVQPGGMIRYSGNRPGVIFMGVDDDSEGVMLLEGRPDDEVAALEAAWLVVGGAGVGELSLVDAGMLADQVDVGLLGRSNGTFQLEEASSLTASTMKVGVRGRGHLGLSDASTMHVETLVLADSIGAFASMNVAEDAFVEADRICLGCYEGFAILGVDGTVETDLLRVGPNGTLRGNVLAVRREAAGKNRASAAATRGITTGALYLSESATLDVDSLHVLDGVLGGTIAWTADFTNRGTLSPGDSANGIGIFSIAGDFAQEPASVLAIDLAEDTHDVLSVTGTANLGGTLRLSFPDNEPIPRGERFEILSARSVLGAFDEVSVAEGWRVDVRYEPEAVVVEVVSAVSTQPRDERPRTLTLDGNYPNPFSTTTSVRFTLPAPGPVRIVVYDAFGRRVRTLTDGARSAGVHEVAFDAADLASGVYFCLIESGGDSLTRPMLLVR